MHGNHRGPDVRPGSKIRTGKRFSARPTACTKTWSGNRPNIVYDGNGPFPTPGPDRNRISPRHKVDTLPAPFSHNEPARNDGMRPFPLVHEKAIAGQAASPRNVRKDSCRKKPPSCPHPLARHILSIRRRRSARQTDRQTDRQTAFPFTPPFPPSGSRPKNARPFRIGRTVPRTNKPCSASSLSPTCTQPPLPTQVRTIPPPFYPFSENIRQDRPERTERSRFPFGNIVHRQQACRSTNPYFLRKREKAHIREYSNIRPSTSDIPVSEDIPSKERKIPHPEKEPGCTIGTRSDEPPTADKQPVCTFTSPSDGSLRHSYRECEFSVPMIFRSPVPCRLIRCRERAVYSFAPSNSRYATTDTDGRACFRFTFPAPFPPNRAHPPP